MKYVLILAAMALSGCSAVLTPIVDEIIDEVFVEYPYIEEPLDEVWHKAAAMMYFENDNYLQSPRETERRGGGDCDEIMAWMIYHLGRKAAPVALHRKKDPKGVNHAVILYDGQLIEPQVYDKVYDEDDYDGWTVTGTYDDVMMIWTAFSTK